MPTQFELPSTVESHVRKEILEKSWGDLEPLEFNEYLLFPDFIHRRRRDGVEQTAVMLRVPRMPDLRQCRLQARKLAQEEGLDPRLDKDMCDDLETLCILAQNIRNMTEPHEPWEPDPRELEKRYDKASLSQAWAKMSALQVVIDPAPNTISPAETLVLLARLAKEKNLGPLAVYSSDVQATFVTSMAAQLLSYLEQKSSSGSSER